MPQRFYAFNKVLRHGRGRVIKVLAYAPRKAGWAFLVFLSARGWDTRGRVRLTFLPHISGGAG